MAALFPRAGLCRSRNLKVVKWSDSSSVKNEQFSSLSLGRTIGNAGDGAHVRTISSFGIFPKARNEILVPRNTVDGNWFAFRGLAALPKTLEELREILAKEKGEVEKELWKNALKIEFEFLRYEKQLMPTFMTDAMWDRIFNEKNVANRRRLYKLLWLKENFKAKRRRNKEELARARASKRNDDFAADFVDENTSGKHSLPMVLNKKIHDATMKNRHEHHLTFAYEFGQPLVFDLGLGREYTMEVDEASSFVKQMRDVYSLNRAQWEPFHLHLSNYDSQSPGLRELVEGNCSNGFSWEVTEDCFTSLFPRERLVYLSPDAPEVATEWRHDDVYIIGGVVDKRCAAKMTLSKIKQLGIRSQRFDIDRYFRKKLAPLLTLDAVFSCLLDARDTDGNWLYSYRHLPRRVVRWRPEFEFMNQVPNFNERGESRTFQCHRGIFKPRITEFPYSEFPRVEDGDVDVVFDFDDNLEVQSTAIVAPRTDAA